MPPTARTTAGSKSDSFALLKDELREIRVENERLRQSLKVANQRIDAERRRADVAEATRQVAWRTLWTRPRPEA